MLIVHTASCHAAALRARSLASPVRVRPALAPGRRVAIIVPLRDAARPPAGARRPAVLAAAAVGPESLPTETLSSVPAESTLEYLLLTVLVTAGVWSWCYLAFQLGGDSSTVRIIAQDIKSLAQDVRAVKDEVNDVARDVGGLATRGDIEAASRIAVLEMQVERLRNELDSC